jgi:hypothetical protein
VRVFRRALSAKLSDGNIALGITTTTNGFTASPLPNMFSCRRDALEGHDPGRDSPAQKGTHRRHGDHGRWIAGPPAACHSAEGRDPFLQLNLTGNASIPSVINVAIETPGLLRRQWNGSRPSAG